MNTALAERRATARWRAFLNERAPLPALLVIAFAQSLSAQVLVAPAATPLRALAAALPLAALLVLLRLMDEVKDHRKDIVAHPERPLPRGLIAVEEARRAVVGLAIALLGVSLALGFVAGAVPALLYAACVGWAWLMYREFYAPQALDRNAFVHALSHQVIVLPMYFFAAAMAAPERAFDAPVIWFALAGLGASFGYEVARKLDPEADPVLGTYRRRHGTGAAAVAILVSLLLASLAAQRIGVEVVAWPLAALTAVVLPIGLRDARRHRWVEGAAGLHAFGQMLAPALLHYLAGGP
ncbi:MAG TPA: hypothetical protein VMN78_02205 [Longimicrobiales bacterium]|nr:hypothetical protein [Longimicrobiales bacterium]